MTRMARVTILVMTDDPAETLFEPGVVVLGIDMTELGKVDDSYKSAVCGGNLGYDQDETSLQKAGYYDHARDEIYAQTKHGAGQDGTRGSKQHMSLPIYKRTKGMLLIKVDAVARLKITSSSVLNDESIVARHRERGCDSAGNRLARAVTVKLHTAARPHRRAANWRTGSSLSCLEVIKASV